VGNAQAGGIGVIGERVRRGAGVDLRDDACGIRGDDMLDGGATDMSKKFCEWDGALVEPVCWYVKLPEDVVVGATKSTGLQGDQTCVGLEGPFGATMGGGGSLVNHAQERGARRFRDPKAELFDLIPLLTVERDLG